MTNLISRDKKVIYLYLFPALLTFIFLLIYNEFGIDIDAYKQFFDWLNPYQFWKLGTDIGYSFLMALIKIWDGKFYLFLACINISAVFIINKIFKNFSPYIALSWLWYIGLFSSYNHTILRQGLALVFILCSLTAILNRHVVLYLLLISFATLIHSSAMFFLPAYWIANIPWKERFVYIALLCSFPLIFIDFTFVLGYIAEHIGLSTRIIEAYFKVDGDNYVRTGFSLGIVVRLFFFIFYALSFNRTSRFQNLLFRLYSFYLILYFPFASIGMLSSRGLDYYKILECFIMSFIILNIRNIYIKYGIVVLIVGYTFMQIHSIIALLRNEQSSLLKMIMNNLM